MNPFKRYTCCLYLLLISIPVFAQTKEKTDIVVKRNGEELKGEVKAMEENVIKFVYSGETLLYTIKKDDISKIVFSSGRVEVMNQPSSVNNEVSSSNANQASVDHHNKVAILPFGFVTDGQQTGEDMSLKVQNECFALLSNHSGFSIMDNHTTNAILIKAGINMQNIMGNTMQEICDILGVEYVISGMVTVNKTNETTYNSNTQNTSTDKKNSSKKSSTYGSSYSTNTQNYATTLQLSIYNDKNESIFNQDRKAFWHDQDAYKATLEYLIKRSPMYKK